MTTTTEKITQAELARCLKVSRGAVSKAVKGGRITPDDEGLFDPIEAELQWLENTRPSINRQSATSKSANTGQHAYAQARARKESALASMAELRLAQTQKDLIPREDVDFVLNDFGSTLRGLMESLPDRLAPIILPMNDMESVSAAIAEAANEILLELSNTMERRANEFEIA
jgi:phage terminase Nu1 subunit (DNA packaging protein)